MVIVNTVLPKHQDLLWINVFHVQLKHFLIILQKNVQNVPSIKLWMKKKINVIVHLIFLLKPKPIVFLVSCQNTLIILPYNARIVLIIKYLIKWIILVTTVLLKIHTLMEKVVSSVQKIPGWISLPLLVKIVPEEESIIRIKINVYAQIASHLRENLNVFLVTYQNSLTFLPFNAKIVHKSKHLVLIIISVNIVLQKIQILMERFVRSVQIILSSTKPLDHVWIVKQIKFLIKTKLNVFVQLKLLSGMKKSVFHVISLNTLTLIWRYAKAVTRICFLTSKIISVNPAQMIHLSGMEWNVNHVKMNMNFGMEKNVFNVSYQNISITMKENVSHVQVGKFLT